MSGVGWHGEGECPDCTNSAMRSRRCLKVSAVALPDGSDKHWRRLKRTEDVFAGMTHIFGTHIGRTYNTLTRHDTVGRPPAHSAGSRPPARYRQWFAQAHEMD